MIDKPSCLCHKCHSGDVICVTVKNDVKLEIELGKIVTLAVAYRFLFILIPDDTCLTQFSLNIIPVLDKQVFTELVIVGLQVKYCNSVIIILVNQITVDTNGSEFNCPPSIIPLICTLVCSYPIFSKVIRVGIT